MQPLVAGGAVPGLLPLQQLQVPQGQRRVQGAVVRGVGGPLGGTRSETCRISQKPPWTTASSVAPSGKVYRTVATPSGSIPPAE